MQFLLSKYLNFRMSTLHIHIYTNTNKKHVVDYHLNVRLRRKKFVALTRWQMKCQTSPRKQPKLLSFRRWYSANYILKDFWAKVTRTLANCWVWIIFMHLLNTGSANWVKPVPRACINWTPHQEQVKTYQQKFQIISIVSPNPCIY